MKMSWMRRCVTTVYARLDPQPQSSPQNRNLSRVRTRDGADPWRRRMAQAPNFWGILQSQQHVKLLALRLPEFITTFPGALDLKMHLCLFKEC